MSSNLTVDDIAPDFTLPTNNDGTVSLSQHKGRPVIVYFYPKDDTPGCTKQAIGFTEMSGEFSELNIHIIGISKDTAVKHDKFIAKHKLTIQLASDVEGEVIEAYGVWVEKNMYGRKYMGIERATFLVDSTGKIVHIWRKVRVKEHVETVLETARQLLT